MLLTPLLGTGGLWKMEKDKVIGMLKRSKNRKMILLTMLESTIPLSSTEIAGITGLNISTVIRALNELTNVKSIIEVTDLKRGKMYKLSNLGKEVLMLLKK